MSTDRGTWNEKDLLNFSVIKELANQGTYKSLSVVDRKANSTARFVQQERHREFVIVALNRQEIVEQMVGI